VHRRDRGLRGRKAEVAAVTAAAMRGEIDWPESLRQRVKALTGLEEVALERVYAERLRFNRGAEKLIAAARRQGVKTLLVSGGFTYFTDRVREQLKLDYAVFRTSSWSSRAARGPRHRPAGGRARQGGARGALEAGAGDRSGARARDRRRRQRPVDDGRSRHQHRLPREAGREGTREPMRWISAAWTAC
jgi:hypothetical protein